MTCFDFEMGKLDLVKMPVLTNLINILTQLKHENDFLVVILKFTLKSKPVYLFRKIPKIEESSSIKNIIVAE